jgi:hypothetical protein
VTAGADAAIGVRRGAFALFGEGRGETQVANARGEAGAAIEATLLGAAIAPCGYVGVLFACVVARMGVLQGRAPDVARPSLGSSFHATLGPRAGVWAPLTAGFGITAFAEMAVPLVRTTLVVDDRPVWTAPAIAGSVAVGVGYVTDPAR